MIRAFLPAKDFAASRAFYEGLGFVVGYHDDSLAMMQAPEGGGAFFLQNYWQKDWAENLMLDWQVGDLEAWYAAAKPAIEALGGKGPSKPALKPWGLVMSDFIDPAGVCWHVQQKSA